MDATAQLIVGPLLLIFGATLLFVGIHGAPRHFSLGDAAGRGGLWGRLEKAGLKPIEARRQPPAQPKEESTPAAPAPTFSTNDKLIAELMTEMVQFREDLNQLRNSVAALAAPSEERARARPRRQQKAAAI